MQGSTQSVLDSVKRAMEAHAASSTPYDQACTILRSLGNRLENCPELQTAIELLEQSAPPFDTIKDELESIQASLVELEVA